LLTGVVGMRGCLIDFGLASLRQLNRVVEERQQSLTNINGAIERRLLSLESATKRLWEVNQTWAWDDNAVMVFRKI
jgi:O-antigen chain-terminating methyltransferase